MKNIGYSFIYGYIGTLLNFLIIGALLVVVNENEDLMVIDFDPDDQTGKSVGEKVKFTLYEILLMAGSLSSKDSFAATLMIDHHAVPILHSLVFGEGIINDAISLSIFEVVHQNEELVVD